MVDHLHVDIKRNGICFGKATAPLTPTQTTIAAALLDALGEVVSYEGLANIVWIGKDKPLLFMSCLRVAVCYIRHALDAIEAPYEILSYRNRGYELRRIVRHET